MSWITFEKEFGLIAFVGIILITLFLYIIVEVQARWLKRKREGK